MVKYSKKDKQYEKNNVLNDKKKQLRLKIKKDENNVLRKKINKIEKITSDKVYNVSPLRYPGGKTRACKKLEEIINKYFDLTAFKVIVSPFFGGGSFEFHIQNNYNMKILGNDKFTPLYNFWQSCKLNSNELCQELYNKLNTIDKDEFMNMRKKIMNETDKLKQSVMYFIINRCSFSGATLSGGFSLESSKKRFTKSSVDRIKFLNLSNFEICNYDFEDFIDKNNDEKNLMFLDPPYYLEKKSKLYGNNGDMHETFDHDKLFKCISSKKNWLMTYNNCDYIKKLYKDYNIIETNWSYGMNKSKTSSEIVIIG